MGVPFVSAFFPFFPGGKNVDYSVLGFYTPWHLMVIGQEDEVLDQKQNKYFKVAVKRLFVIETPFKDSKW